MKNKTPYIIMKRELASYFSSPIAYIVTGIFLAVCGVFFYSVFFLQNRADLRSHFALLPILLSLFIPAITMRLFAEEKRSTSIETLMTLPVTTNDVVLGKFLSAWISSCVMVFPTLLYALPLFMFGSPDIGSVLCGFLGSVFLCAAFSAIGIFSSAVTKNQIIAFFASLAFCVALTMIDTFLIFLPGKIVEFFSYLSANAHFTSIARGIIDTRDLIYFSSITVFFFYLTVVCLNKERG